MDLTDVQCLVCYRRFRGGPERTFMGFQRFVCPFCHDEFVYPLTDGWKSFYWYFGGTAALATVGSALIGHLVLPGLLSAAMIAALVKNWRVQREVDQLPPDPGPTVKRND